MKTSAGGVTVSEVVDVLGLVLPFDWPPELTRSASAVVATPSTGVVVVVVAFAAGKSRLA